MPFKNRKAPAWFPRLLFGGSPEEGGSIGRPRIGLALSSGGAKGLAHIGVIQVLEENGIRIDAIAASSMGAYVGSLWAAGHSGEQLEALAAEMRTRKDIRSLADPVFPPRRGFLKGDRIGARLGRSLGEVKFEELKRDLYVVATQLDSLARVVFDKGYVLPAVRASIAIPGVFRPAVIDGREYVDGGVSDPLPVGVLKSAGMDKIIAVSVMPTIEELTRSLEEKKALRKNRGFFSRGADWLNLHFNYFAPGNLLDILRSSAMGSQLRLVETSARQADVFLRPVTADNRWHDYRNYERYIRVGREAAEAALPKILDLVHATPAKEQKQCA